MYRLEIELDGLPNLANRVFRGNWRGRHGATQAWKKKVISAIGGRIPPEPLTKAKLTLTRFSSAEPDFDGLVTSFKPCIDSLIVAGIIVDDKRANVGVPEYLWERAAPKQGRIRIKVEEI